MKVGDKGGVEAVEGVGIEGCLLPPTDYGSGQRHELPRIPAENKLGAFLPATRLWHKLKILHMAT